jgi:hypothetical protein
MGNTLEENEDICTRRSIFTFAKPTGVTDSKPRKSEGPARRWMPTLLRTRDEAARVRVTGPTLIKFAPRVRRESSRYRLTLRAMLMPGYTGLHR